MTERRVPEPRSGGRRIAKTVGAFALGAAAGSILALLYAPASGRVTRKRIGMKIRALRHETARRLTRTKKLLVRKAGELREVTADRFSDARDWVTEHVTNGNGRHTTKRRVARHA